MIINVWCNKIRGCATPKLCLIDLSTSQTRQFLPTRKILAVERVDESAFQKPNVFQVVSKGYDEALQILYLAAQVNYTIVTSETHAIMQTVRILRGKINHACPDSLYATQRLLLSPQARASLQATKKLITFYFVFRMWTKWISGFQR